ncbi:MAG: ScpA family protein [Acetobacteraceae bacterium]
MANSSSEHRAPALVLHLDGFDGPLDLLLDLARAQKVDLARISILALVEQYLAIVEGARRMRLELAADWLVMAAWLVWLKSRLLVPDNPEAIEEGETAAGALAERLAILQGVRAAAAWLDARPQLGREVFARGAPEDLVEIDRTRLRLDLPSLMRAYIAAVQRAASSRAYRPRPLTIWTVQDALARLIRLLGVGPDWASLERFLPDSLGGATQRRAALASTLLASLELARDGSARLRQEQPFGPIWIGRA